MSRPSATIPLATLLLGCGALAAEDGIDDGTFTDVRIEASLLPEDYDYDAEASLENFDDVTIDIDGEEEWDDAWRIGLAAQTLYRGEGSPVGLSAGGVLGYQRLEFDGEAAEEEFEALSISARLGIGVTLGSVFLLEAYPFAGIGAARGEVGDADSDDVGLYWEYGLMAAGTFTFGNALQVGVHAGWLHSEYDLDFGEDERFEDLVEDVEVELENEGLFVGASVGWRL